MTYYYFAYGMNTNPSLMNYNSLANPVGRATLTHFHLKFAFYATIAPGGSMKGVLWEIDEDTLIQLDEREGFPDLYTRFKTNVTNDETGEQVIAIVYQMTPKYVKLHGTNNVIHDQYIDMLRVGYRIFGIPQKQIDAALTHYLC